MPKKTPAEARKILRDGINSLRISRKRLEHIIQQVKTQNKSHMEDIKDLEERVSILERKSWGARK